MRNLFSLVTPFVLALAASACGGGEKKAEEPTPNAVTAPVETPDPVAKPEGAADGVGKGGDIDDDPLPNPCGGGN